MTRDDIIRLAREAQMPFYWRTGEITYLDKLERFAALVAAAERKACAKVCERDDSIRCLAAAEAIRNRGKE